MFYVLVKSFDLQLEQAAPYFLWMFAHVGLTTVRSNDQHSVNDTVFWNKGLRFSDIFSQIIVSQIFLQSIPIFIYLSFIIEF